MSVEEKTRPISSETIATPESNVDVEDGEIAAQAATKRGRIAVVRHGEYFQPHPRRDIFALRDAGFAVDVICDSEPGKPHLERVDGVTVIRLPIRHRRGKMPRYLFEYLAFPLFAGVALAVLSVWRRYDYVEIDTMPTWLIAAALVPKCLGSTVVLYMFEHMAELTATDRGLTDRHWLIRFIDAVEMACVRAADVVITPAERNRELYVQRGVPANKMVFIPNCPDERVFLPSGFDLRSSLEAANQDTSAFRLVTHGSLLERYGIQVLIRSVARLRSTIPGINLDVIGSGEYETELINLARSQGVNDIVNFVGPVPFEEMAQRLLGANIGLGPYLLDLLPNKLMEYLLLGIPVVASDFPTMRRYFGDDAVTYVRPNDVDALTTAVESLYRQPGLRRRQATQAHEQYLSTLAWRRTRNNYLAVYGVIPRPASSNGHVRKREESSPLARLSWLRFVLGQSRGPRNTLARLPTILSRFGISSAKGRAHLEAFLYVTERQGVKPTLLVTAMTAERHPDVIRALQDRGVEIGAHGLVHNDYSALASEEQIVQVNRACELLTSLGLVIVGWRCPYSRLNEHTLPALRSAGMQYDATPVYEWPAFERLGISMTHSARADYERLCALFGVQSATDRAVLPRLINGLVQIPMSIPQDEDMVDRLHLSAAQMTKVWRWMLGESRRVGETFVICLHPERAKLMAHALDATLSQAGTFGDVWIAPLRDISEWWRERSAAAVTIGGSAGRWKMNTTASDRVVTCYGTQSVFGSATLLLESAAKPVVGMSDLWPEATRSRIQDCGFPIEVCGPKDSEVFLDHKFPPSSDANAVVRWLTETGKMVRIQPWPAGYRSCLSVTGDLDALTLIDFVMRLKEFS